MHKLVWVALLLTLPLFLVNSSWAWGWLWGWLTMIILHKVREPILERVINFQQVQVRRYVLYLLGVMVWVAIPLLVAFNYPGTVNPYAVFLAYILSRISMFLHQYTQAKEGRR